MQHHDVYHVDAHDYCEETSYCKRCGLHQQQIEDLGYRCRFALNLTAISHLRAMKIKGERIERSRREMVALIERFRRKLREAKDAETES